MRGFLRMIAVTAAFLAVAQGAAEASTVEVEVTKTPSLAYDAAGSERNRVTIETTGSVVTVRDPGADIEAGNGCTSVSDHEATCALAGSVLAVLTLGNNADSVGLGAMVRMVASGGDGADELTGGDSRDDLTGGDGPDRLLGMGGTDFAFYVNRKEDLRVSLGDDVRNDGGARDGQNRDLLRGIESVLGGEGDDRLTGDGQANVVRGLAGDDLLDGKGGPDTVIGDEGKDVQEGGGGDDLFTPDPGRDRMLGGGGADRFQMGLAGGSGSDLFAGGEGSDVLQGPGFAPIFVKLDGDPNDGQCVIPCESSVESDNAKGIERIESDSGDDLLIGSERNETFKPSAGADGVRARDGDDIIEVSADGAVDLYDCGPGSDDLAGTPDPSDLAVDCES